MSSSIRITFELSSGNHIILMTELYEMLEHPELIRKNLSNVCSPGNYAWLLDEIESFRQYIDEWNSNGNGKKRP